MGVRRSAFMPLVMVLVGYGLSLQAASAEDFYKGKTISIYAGRPPGGGVDTEMRLVAQYLAESIPGKPSMVPQNMPGAGGIALGNFLYNQAPKDGLTIGVPGRTAFLLSPVVGNPNARYKLQDFTWIGSAASSNFMLWIRKGAGINSVEDLRNSKKKIVIGGSSAGNSDTVVPELLAKYEGFPFNVVKGYPGTAEQALAMERGEIDGMFTGRESFRTDPVASGLAVPILQTFPIEPNIPTTEQIAADPMEKKLLKLFSVPLKVGLALVAPPGIPKEQAQILRDAYVKTVTDPVYIAEAKKRGFEVSTPNSGEQLAKFLDENLSNIPPDVIAEFKRYAGD
jgi:tripartite-type tricarboxylate transporter receptor subunit TctC